MLLLFPPYLKLLCLFSALVLIGLFENPRLHQDVSYTSQNLLILHKHGDIYFLLHYLHYLIYPVLLEKNLLD